MLAALARGRRGVAVVVAELAAGSPLLRAARRRVRRGLLFPVTLDIQDGLRTLHYIAPQRSAARASRRASTRSRRRSRPRRRSSAHEPVIVFLLAGLAGVLGIVRRDPRPVVWAVGALSMGAMAFARPPNVALLRADVRARGRSRCSGCCSARRVRARRSSCGRSCSSSSGRRGTTATVPAPSRSASRRRSKTRSSTSTRTSRPGEVALVPSYWPFEDSRYFELVQIYVEHSPDYPYRSLPDHRRGALVRASAPDAPALLRRARKRPTSPVETQVALGELGTYTLVPTPVRARRRDRARARASRSRGEHRPLRGRAPAGRS